MSFVIGCCVYCERSPADIVAAEEALDLESALHQALIADNIILLCVECLSQFTTPGAVDPVRIQHAVVTFPPGVTAIDHFCIALEEGGLPEAYCEFTMAFEREGNYYFARCPHCGVRVRSLADD